MYCSLSFCMRGRAKRESTVFSTFRYILQGLLIFYYINHQFYDKRVISGLFLVFKLLIQIYQKNVQYMYITLYNRSYTKSKQHSNENFCYAFPVHQTTSKKIVKENLYKYKQIRTGLECNFHNHCYIKISSENTQGPLFLEFDSKMKLGAHRI